MKKVVIFPIAKLAAATEILASAVNMDINYTITEIAGKSAALDTNAVKMESA